VKTACYNSLASVMEGDDRNLRGRRRAGRRRRGHNAQVTAGCSTLCDCCAASVFGGNRLCADLDPLVVSVSVAVPRFVRTR
jgi:hypothetical protein